ncbi:uncharacterized protein LJ206_013560 [Theristicus caerulescens]
MFPQKTSAKLQHGDDASQNFILQDFPMFSGITLFQKTGVAVLDREQERRCFFLDYLNKVSVLKNVVCLQSSGINNPAAHTVTKEECGQWPIDNICYQGWNIHRF